MLNRITGTRFLLVGLLATLVAGGIVLAIDRSRDDTEVVGTGAVADAEQPGDDGASAVEGFAEDLAEAKAITKVSMGDPCENADPSWLKDRTEPPALVPVEGVGEDGSCVVGGWSYRMAERKELPFELPERADGYVLQPIFDESGQVIDYHDRGLASDG